MLLGLIVALMVMAIWMTAAAPDVRIQAQREAETDMFYAGDQMAEAIARYYSGGRLNAAGLVVKTPPPPYGYLDELKKLRDGVTIGVKQVRFVRGSAFLDPITHEEWEPVRIGDPRIKKFLLAWSRSTGRPIPQAYLQYVGVIAEDDIADPDADGDEDEKPATPNAAPPRPAQPPAGGAGEDDEDEDEGWDEELDEEDEEEEEMDKAISALATGASPFVDVALQSGQPGGVRPQAPGGRRPAPRRQPAPLFSRTDPSRNPIIGVVSKSKAKAVRTRYGIETHGEMLFIYMPPPPRGNPRLGPPVRNPGQQGQPGPGGGLPPGFTDNNGDGIDDRYQNTNKPPN
jgi:hypothetical protein